jgi:hypothetical protein
MRFRLKLWLAAFLYALVAGLVIQLLLLPYVFPGLHGGSGLLAGHDWNGFHEQAVEQASRIGALGWQEFRLRPDGENIITGLCSVLYYFIAPQPWTLLPINAALFACASLALFLLVKFLGVSDRTAATAIVPFVCFPSSAVQFSQIHKDVFCTASLLVILWCWVSLLQRDFRIGKAIGLLLLAGTATGIVWLFRPYFMQILLLWTGVLAAWCFFSGVFSLAKRKPENIAGVAHDAFAFRMKSTVVMLVLLAITYLYYSSYLDLRFSVAKAAPSASNENLNRTRPDAYGFPNPHLTVVPRSGLQSAEAAQMSEASSPSLDEFLADAAKHNRPVAVMKEGAPLANLVNKVFLKLAVARGGFTNSGKTATTNVDREVVFYNAQDVLRYVPRALQVGFFAPFPQAWAVTENQKSSRMEIYISVIEMMLCYVALLGWIYWVLNIRVTDVALWIPALFAGSVILLMGLTVANVGTLYRMRFPFLMCFVSFGIAGLLQWLKRDPGWIWKK